MVNKIKCLRCKDEIESTHRHDFKWCSCKSVSVDGGNDYQKICGNAEDIAVWKDGKYEPL